MLCNLQRILILGIFLHRNKLIEFISKLLRFTFFLFFSWKLTKSQYFCSPCHNFSAIYHRHFKEYRSLLLMARLVEKSTKRQASYNACERSYKMKNSYLCKQIMGKSIIKNGHTNSQKAAQKWLFFILSFEKGPHSKFTFQEFYNCCRTFFFFPKTQTIVCRHFDHG